MSNNIIKNHSYSDSINEKIDKIILHVLKEYPDLRDHEQHFLFTKLCFYDISKNEFRERKNNILKQYGKSKLTGDVMTLTDVRALYHLKEGMLSSHLDNKDTVEKAVTFFTDLFTRQENDIRKKLEDPDYKVTGSDMYGITKTARILNELIVTDTNLSLGTPIVMYFKFMQQKGVKSTTQDAVENQNMFEKDTPKNITKLINDAKLDNNNKEALEHINNTLDQLERSAKLKNVNDQRRTTSNSNGVRNEQHDQSSTVSGDISNGDSTGNSTTDRRAEYFKKDHSRRSEEGLFS